MSFVDESACYVALPEKGPLLEHSPRHSGVAPKGKGTTFHPARRPSDSALAICFGSQKWPEVRTYMDSWEL